MQKFDWIVVGAGFTGAVVAEQIASRLDQRVLIVDRRDHIAGNAYDYELDNGILVHKYGPHIFHTNSQMVWKYLSRFTAWRPYFHRVLGMVEGNAIPVPFNLNSIAQAFPPYLSESISRKLIDTYGFGKKIPILKLREHNDSEVKFVADYVYNFVFKNYTMKQWNVAPEDLDPSVTARVPIFISRDDRYFQDTYQAMPALGYTELFKKLLAHKNIHLELSTEFKSVRDTYPDAKVVFTGPIDEYFEFTAGLLPYRSLRFNIREEVADFYQAAGTVNYPNEFDFTRITEMKYLTGQSSKKTVLIEEYPQDFERGVNDPYYPIPNAQNDSLFKAYREMAKTEKGRVYFAGRLGDYAYYNMDQACARALALFEKEILPGATR